MPDPYETLLSVLRARWSCRAFLPDPVDGTDISRSWKSRAARKPTGSVLHFLHRRKTTRHSLIWTGRQGIPVFTKTVGGPAGISFMMRLAWKNRIGKVPHGK